MTDQNNLVPIVDEARLEDFKERALALVPTSKPEIGGLIALGIKNFLGSIPLWGIATNTAYDYYAERVIEKRFSELESYARRLDEKMDAHGRKVNATDYLENSLLYKYETIIRKLLENPGRGFDELLAEFVTQSLIDTETSPEMKDYIVTSLLELDAIDVTVLVILDAHFCSNLKTTPGAKGVTRDSLVTLLAGENINKVLIGRSLQRLQSQYLIRNYSSTTATVQEQPSPEGLYNGEMSPQFDSPGGFLATDYGREFLKFLKLEK